MTTEEKIELITTEADKRLMALSKAVDSARWKLSERSFNMKKELDDMQQYSSYLRFDIDALKELDLPPKPTERGD